MDTPMRPSVSSSAAHAERQATLKRVWPVWLGWICNEFRHKLPRTARLPHQLTILQSEVRTQCGPRVVD